MHFGCFLKFKKKSIQRSSIRLFQIPIERFSWPRISFYVFFECRFHHWFCNFYQDSSQQLPIFPSYKIVALKTSFFEINSDVFGFDLDVCGLPSTIFFMKIRSIYTFLITIFLAYKSQTQNNSHRHVSCLWSLKTVDRGWSVEFSMERLPSLILIGRKINDAKHDKSEKIDIFHKINLKWFLASKEYFLVL